MNDRELLEAAARAAGYPEHSGWLTYPEGSAPPGLRWNALTDDSDALRLAVKLRLGLYFETQSVPTVDDIHTREDVEIVEVFGPMDEETGGCHCEMHSLDDDPYAATRRAITRAAAELGRAVAAKTGEV